MVDFKHLLDDSFDIEEDKPKRQQSLSLIGESDEIPFHIDEDNDDLTQGPPDKSIGYSYI